MADEMLFNDKESIRAWMKDKPPEWARVLAGRAALRVFPLLAQDWRSGRELERKEGFTLLSARANCVSRLARKWPSRETRSAANAAADAAIAAAIAAAANAAAAATRAANAAATRSAAADAADAATRAAAADAAAIWKSLSDDATRLSAGEAPALLEIARMWPAGEPDWFGREWRSLRQRLEADGDHWTLWIDWYRRAIRGSRSIFGLAPEGDKAVADRLVAVKEEFWRQPAETVNRQIAAWIDEERKKAIKVVVPPQTPAAIEPEWRDGRLTLVAAPAASDFAGGDIGAALAGLKAALGQLSADIAGESNIDRRFKEWFARLVDRIPASVPSQDVLFTVAHNGDVLSGYLATANAEWERTLAARLAALALQFGRTFDKFPEWRAFKRAAPTGELDAKAVSEARELVGEAAAQLAAPEMAPAIDPVVPQGLEQVAQAVPEVQPDPAGRLVVTPEAESRAWDALQSLGNVLKRLAEAALWTAGKGKDFVQFNWEHFSKDLPSNYAAELKKTSKWSVEFLFKALRFGVRAAAIGGGVGLAEVLAAKFPTIFGWLTQVLDILTKTIAG